MEDQVSRRHYVLVHGSCHGAWCWYKVVELLRKAGHQATAIDLAGCGVDLTDPDSVSSFQQYNQPLMDFLSTLSPSQRSQVILVGHSFGGISISYACEAFPGEFAALVFVAGAVTPSGLPFAEHFSKVFSNCSLELFYKNSRENDPTSFIFTQDSLQATLFNMSPSEDITLASMLMRPHPVAAQLAPKLHITEEGFQTIHKIYIHTTYDVALPLSIQKGACKKHDIDETYELASDHSPFFSTPKELQELLTTIQTQHQMPN